MLHMIDLLSYPEIIVLLLIKIRLNNKHFQTILRNTFNQFHKFLVEYSFEFIRID